MRNILILFFIVICNIELNAQNTAYCQDTLRQPNEYYACYDEFNPKCGCDGVTYRNECSAYYKGAINSYQDGPCGLFEIDIVPNPVTELLYMSFYTRERMSVNIFIYDAFGGTMFRQSYIGKEEDLLRQEINVSGYYHGVYFVVAVAGGELYTRKFVKAVNP